MKYSSMVLACVAPFVLACASAHPTTAPGSAPVPESRVFQSEGGRSVGFASFADAVARSDVVFFGEEHGDPATHRAELALLAALGARRPNVVVSLEFFERDVQSTLDAYLAGQISESLFVATTRPPRRYTSDYRPLVELARANGWPVVASNVPRRIAALVSRAGLGAIDTLPDRAMAARELSCPRDRYFERFAETMTSHNDSAGPPAPKVDSAAALARTVRYYEAQCVKDETMGESIAAAWRKAGPGAIVIHYNGSFHTDMGQGTAARARRRLPGVKSLIVTAVPVDDVGRATPASSADRADYVVIVPKPPKAPAPGRTP